MEEEQKEEDDEEEEQEEERKRKKKSKRRGKRRKGRRTRIPGVGVALLPLHTPGRKTGGALFTAVSACLSLPQQRRLPHPDKI